MNELKEQEIKLFGKKIGLPEYGKIFPVVVSGEDSIAGESVSACGVVISKGTSIGSGRDRCLVDEKLSSPAKHEADAEIDYHKQQVIKDHITGEISEAKSKEKDQNQMQEGSGDSKTSSESDNNPKTPSIDEDSPALKSSETESDQNDATSSQQQPLKKPEKIIPCPRCNSMDTKFCYYNNYNVNQPRHFCKSCQRYWTAGGTTRNVPVGAGRRKNKSSAMHYHNIMISQALQGTKIDPANRYNHSTFNTNGTVLSFGPDSSLHEPTASMLNLGEKNAPNGIRNGFYKLERENSTRKGGENGDGCSSGSSVTTSNSMVEGGTSAPHEAVAQNINGLQSPCLSGVPWPFAWNAAVPVPAICPPGFSLQFCPAPYWNCNVLGPWSVPWLTPPSPTANQQGSGYVPNSFLGKRSRDGDLLKPNNPEDNDPAERIKTERSILVPKTLRIDDPDEAAKSSIWSTLGIEYNAISRGGLFKALQPNSDEKVCASNTSSMLQANPAALSRSLSFQERA